MKVITKCFVTLIMVGLIMFLSFGGALFVAADTGADGPAVTQEEETGVGDTVEESDTDEDNDVTEKSDLAIAAEKFVEYLKEKYGTDYEYYYNMIIDEWGSIEGYLLAFGDKLPEEHKSGWDKFVGWLGDYSAVWAPALAIAIVIAVSLVGKKQFDKLIEKVVNGKLKPVVNELNLQSTALTKMLGAQRALLGNCEKFSEEAKGLEEAQKELEK